MPQKLKVELFIPTLYNPDKDGLRKAIEPSKRRQVKNYIVKKYGGISIHPLTIQGTWVDKRTNTKYFDACKRYEICIDMDKDIQDVEKELSAWKERLKKTFEQVEIYMTFYEVTQI